MNINDDWPTCFCLFISILFTVCMMWRFWRFAPSSRHIHGCKIICYSKAIPKYFITNIYFRHSNNSPIRTTLDKQWNLHENLWCKKIQYVKRVEKYIIHVYMYVSSKLRKNREHLTTQVFAANRTLFSFINRTLLKHRIMRFENWNSKQNNKQAEQNYAMFGFQFQ